MTTSLVSTMALGVMMTAVGDDFNHRASFNGTCAVVIPHSQLILRQAATLPPARTVSAADGSGYEGLP